MAKIAILGFGVIGKGVFDVFEKNGDEISKAVGENTEIAKVVDIRDLSETKAANVATADFNEVLCDKSIGLVVECMGGHTLAYEFSKKALEAGKHVVTSNKEVVCCYGDELMELAYKNHVCYLFEASVGGGIPIIHPLRYCLWANKIESITGILNGTTNFMLTVMNEKGVSFDEALATAQKLGYAEKDPTADVDGFDAARKIAILASVATNKKIALEDVSVIEGIRKITAEDVAFAAKAGMKIKLLARAVKEDGKLSVYVAPHFINENDALAAVSDVFNAVSVDGNVLGRSMYYGRGAGSLATASAVVSDVIEAFRTGCTAPVWTGEKFGVENAQSLKSCYYVRAKASGNEIYKAITDAFEKPTVLSEENGDTLAFITNELTRDELDKAIEKLGITCESVIRVLCR